MVIGLSIVGVVFVVICGSLLVPACNRPPVMEPPISPVADAAKPPISITLSSLVRSYETNSAAASKSWEGVQVKTIGTVDSIAGTTSPTVYLTQDDSRIGCHCNQDEAAKLFRGQKVKVTGKVGMYVMGRLFINDCTFTPE